MIKYSTLKIMVNPHVKSSIKVIIIMNTRIKKNLFNQVRNKKILK